MLEVGNAAKDEKRSCTFRKYFRFRPELLETGNFPHLDRNGSSGPEEFGLAVPPKWLPVDTSGFVQPE